MFRIDQIPVLTSFPTREQAQAIVDSNQAYAEGETYVVHERVDGWFVVAVYDEVGEFVFYL